MNPTAAIPPSSPHPADIDRNTDDLLHEYAYNGVGHRIGWWNSSDSQWIYFAYDESWRMVASYRTTDTTPKELFINHQAGMGGTNLGLGLDACVARLKDASVSWTTTTDGVLEERVYYCQELRSGRADVVHLIDTSGARVESVRYSPYGVPFGIPSVDFNADGAKTSADQTLLTAATGYSAGSGNYNAACDINLDGTVDSTDQTLYTGYSGGTLGRGNMSRNIVRNRKGYAGYEHDGVLDSLMHVRHRVYESELGRWVQRDPLGFVDGGNIYAYIMSQPLQGIDPMGTCIGCTTAAPVAHGGGLSISVGPISAGNSNPDRRRLCEIIVGERPGNGNATASTAPTQAVAVPIACVPEDQNPLCFTTGGGGASSGNCSDPGRLGFMNCDYRICCVCTRNIDRLFPNQGTNTIIRRCTLAHEEARASQCDNSGSANNYYSLSRACRDCVAWSAHANCLQAAIDANECGSDAVCRSEIQTRRDAARIAGDSACHQCLFVEGCNPPV